MVSFFSWEDVLPVVWSARCLFVVFFVFNYFRWFGNVWGFWRLRPIHPSENPKYTSKDVTVCIPTITDEAESLRETLISVLRNDPSEILLVTIKANEERLRRLAETLSKRITVLTVEKANKRRQMNMGIQHVTTELIVFADDDVFWGDKVLLWMLAPFEDSQMGGVVTNQRLRREQNPNLVNFFAAGYLLRRNFDCAACTYMDGGMPCLSGRTVAYRTSILKDPDFARGFADEKWRIPFWKNYRMNADDDNFLSRWMVSHGWKTWMQFHQECEVQTTLESTPKNYIKQCLRWSRSNWRSNLKSMVSEGHVWSRHPWSSYAVFQTTISSWAMIIEPLMTWLLTIITSDRSLAVQQTVLALWLLWIWFIVKIPKYYSHFRRYPQDLVFLPQIKLFGYFHNCIKLYALFTLHKTAWGTREGADADADDNLRMEPPPYTPFPPYSSCIDEMKSSTPHLRPSKRGSEEFLIHLGSEKEFV